MSANIRYGRNVLEADNTYSVPINGKLRWLETALSAYIIMRLGALRIVNVKLSLSRKKNRFQRRF